MEGVSLPPIGNGQSNGSNNRKQLSTSSSTNTVFDGVPEKKYDSPPHGTIVYDEDGRKAYHSPPSKKLPPFTEAYMSSPSTAGIPVLEIVRRLEEEKALRKEDREALNEALYDSTRREKIIKTLGDIELGVNPKFAIKRLRALIHGNMGGEISSSKAVSSLVTNSKQYSMKDQLLLPYSLAQPGLDSHRAEAIQPPQAPTSSSQHHVSSTIIAPVPPVGLPPSGANTSASSKVQQASHKQQTQPQQNHHQQQAQQQPTAVPLPIAATAGAGAGTGAGAGAGAVVEHSHDDNDASVATTVNPTQLAVEAVVGAAPLYSGPENFNALFKIKRQFQHFMHKRGAQNKTGAVRLAIIVGAGSYNPLTRMHMRTFFLAKEYLESRCGFFVLGSLLCPAHAATVRERYRTDVTEVIPSPHRVAIAQLMVEESRHLAIDPWEITRRRAMDYLSLLQHTASMVKESFANLVDPSEIKILYLCKANAVPKLSPQALRAEGFGCICVCRAPDSDNLRDSLSSKWSGLIWIVEDTAILDASFDVVTSRKVRDNIKAGISVEGLVGKKVQDYIKAERLGPKMNRLEEWGDGEKFLPKIESRRPATRPKPTIELNSI